MLYSDDCIAAISTPAGSGGIAIIRISGKDAFFIADKMFCANKEGVLSHCVSKMPDHTIKHGYVFDGGELVDECLLSKMEAPRTYTAENVVEVNCHGGFAVATKILELAIRCGARPAEPGEFTKRAFLNGRLDLSEAEGVMDIINAKTEESRKAAARQLSGRLSRQIEDICGRLVKALAEMEVSIDYPEYEMDEQAGDDAFLVLKSIKEELRKLSATYDRGRLVRDGLKLVIAGLPNAGKSSLMNMLSGYNRSIVTDIPGTTRDTVDEFVQIDGVPIIITDTAGIRETEDTVEKIGVERAYEKIEEADLVVYVADCLDFEDDNEGANALRQEHIANVSRLTPENSVVIINKTDLDGEDGNASKKAEEFFKDFTCIKASILENKGVEPVFDIIKTRFLDQAAGYGSQNIITNIRHKTLIDQALSLLTAAEESLLGGMPLDCVSYDVRLCSEKLGEIIGKNISEDVIHDIFSRFCLGK